MIIKKNLLSESWFFNPISFPGIVQEKVLIGRCDHFQTILSNRYNLKNWRRFLYCILYSHKLSVMIIVCY
jgi:hypothetical protein